MRNIKLLLVLLAAFVGSLYSSSAWANRTVYFINVAKWDPIRIYIWEDGNGDNNHNASWTNQPWVLDSEKTGKQYRYGDTFYDVYSWELTNDKWNKLLFSTTNNKNDNSIVSSQTNDIAYTEDMLVIVKGNKSEETKAKGEWGFAKENSYTFYIVNNTSESTINAHYWEKNQAGLMTSWPGTSVSMTATDKKFGGKTVYSATISSLYDTKWILFNVNGNKKFGDGDVAFGDGYLFELNSGSTTPHKAGEYSFDNVQEPDPDDPDPDEPDDPSGEYTRTFYIVNKTSWSSVFGHYWEAKNEKTNTTVWPGQELKLTATNETYDKQPVYKVTISANYPADKIIFSNNGGNQTTDLNLADGYLYILPYSSSSDLVTNPSFDRKPDPVIGRTLFFDFGQDRSNKGNKGIVPKIYLWSSVKSKSDKPVEANMKEMFHSDAVDSYHDLWYYVIDEADKDKYKDFSFIYYFNDENKQSDRDFEYYTVGAGRVTGDNYCAPEMDKLYDYVYTTHGENIAVQSYIRPEQYIPLRQAEKKEIYLLGNGLKYGNRSLTWKLAEEDVVTIPTDDRGAVFYLPVKFDGNWVKSGENGDNTKGVDGAAFKMSWIKPSQYANGNNNSGRLWATFNIGVIGYAKSRNDAAIADEEYRATMSNAGDNWNVWAKTSCTYRLNNHDQYNWFIPKSTVGNATDYLLIVDLDDDCQSVTLLSFTPDPTVTARDASMKATDLIGPMKPARTLKGEANNGSIHYMRANMVTATIDVDIPGEDVLAANQYTAQYQLYSNEERLGQPVESPKGIRVRGLAIGEDATVGARAKYTDGKTSFTFHTRYDSDAISAEDITLETPYLAIDETDGNKPTYVSGSANLDKDTPYADRWYTLGAYANVKVTHCENPNGYNYFVDFEAEHQGGTAKGGELMHANHYVWTAENTPSVVRVMDGWVHQGDSDYDDSRHNWSWAMSQTTKWPVHLPGVVTIHRDEDNNDIIPDGAFDNTVLIKARYVYPLVINTNATPEIITGKSNAPARVETRDAEDNQGWVLTLMHGPEASAPVKLGSSDLTGVLDLKADADADAPVEYYNLQGMRLNSAPESGLYIRRQGTKTEKIIIR